MRTDREKHGLTGPVKSVHVETARLQEQDGGLTEEHLFSQIMTFNQEGGLIEQVDCSPGGVQWRTVNEYTDSGQLLATKGYDSSGALISEWRYIYDDEGRLKAEQYTTLDGKVTTPTRYTYDSEGKRIKIQEYDFSGESHVMIGIEGTGTFVDAGDARRVETLYDDRGAAVEVRVFNADQALVTRIEIKRDSLGNPLEELQYIGDVFPFGPCASGSCSEEPRGPLSEEQQAEFEEVARLFSPGSVMSTHTHRYDAAGRLVESELTMMGMKANRQTFRYDDEGNKLEEANYGDEGKPASKAIFTREYDSHGNWTKELVSTASSWDAEFGLSTPVHVTYRVISYW
ncbi:MAG TPA: hypothetical protein VF074_03010 [Pyrinomonadaceae bacterium]